MKWRVTKPQNQRGAWRMTEIKKCGCKIMHDGIIQCLVRCEKHRNIRGANING